MPQPPTDAVTWAYWFLEPNTMHATTPNSGPYMNYLTLAQFLVECDMEADPDAPTP